MPKIKMVALDLDDTLTTGQSWERLNATLGVTKDEDLRFYTKYNQGELTYHEWMDELFSIYKERGTPTKDKIESCLREVTYKEGAIELVKYLKERGYIVVLISGSIDVTVKKVADDLGVDNYYSCTTFRYDENNVLTDILHLGDEGSAKLGFLKDAAKKHGIRLEECASIADGANDKEMFKASGLSITFKDSPFRGIANHTVSSLNEILNIL